jgi:hypothetical protein
MKAKTPRQKAKELVKTYKEIKVGMSLLSYTEKAVECSIICVKQMILSHETWETEQSECIEELNLVLKELELL